MASTWNILGLAPGADERSVKRAYATLLKKTRPEDDPIAYQALREAYDDALAMARQISLVECETTQASALDRPPADAHDGGSAIATAKPLAEQDAADARAQREAAWHQAGVLWQQFLATSSVSPRLKLAQMGGPGAGLSLLGHEALEVMAARWCAAEECDPDLREAIVEHFGWIDDCRHLERLDGDTVHHALARLRAYRAFASIRADGSIYVTGALFSRTVPRYPLRLLNGAFIREMRQIVQQVRWHVPELLHFHLDRAVFEWWEARVLVPRVTVQSLLLSIVAGLLIFGVTTLLMPPSDEAFWWRLLSCEVVAILAGVWVSLKSSFIVERMLAFRHQYFDQPLFGEHHKRLRYGWIGFFVPASLAMFIPQPGAAVQSIVALAMAVSAAAALYGAMPALRAVGYVLIAAVAGVMGSLLKSDVFASQHIVACIGLAACVHTLLITHGMRQQDLALPSARLAAVRYAWLTGSVALIVAPCLVGLPYAAAPMLWLWVLAGAIIGTYSASVLIVFPCYIALWVVIHESYQNADAVSDKLVIPIESLLLALAVHVAMSLWWDRRHNK